LHAPNLATAIAARALRRLAARLHAAARALLTARVLGEGDLFCHAENGFFQRQMQVVAQVLPTLNALPGAALARRTEERLEQVLDRQPDEIAEVDAGAALALERGVPVAVVHAALLGVREHLVGLGGFLEALRGLRRLVAVRVV